MPPAQRELNPANPKLPPSQHPVSLSPLRAMRLLAIKTQTPSAYPLPQPRNPKRRASTISKSVLSTATNPNFGYCSERGLNFEIGGTFFRHESATGRDLAVLAASVHRRSSGSLRVLDAMCGCGVRSLRYLAEAEADFVLANDANENCGRIVLSNLSRVSRASEGRWAVVHSEANRLMAEHYLRRDLFDLIDIDSFGSDSSFLRSAFNALKYGGLVYVTSTDGCSSGGHRPQRSLASYGAYVRPMPYANEVGLRMLIGGAVRDASVLGYTVSPLFSYYSYHGPVFRVMLRLHRGKPSKNSYYGFITYCTKCGNSRAYSWDELSHITCPCTSTKVSCSIVVSGPLWTGPLHNATYIAEMLGMAEERGWAGNGAVTGLEKLLKLMIDESNPELPFGYIKLDEVARRAKVNSPPRRVMLDSVHKEGYAVSRSHIASNAIKTNCDMAECIRIAKELQQC